jgi:hypothetical protein
LFNKDSNRINLPKKKKKTSDTPLIKGTVRPKNKIKKSAQQVFVFCQLKNQLEMAQRLRF